MKKLSDSGFADNIINFYQMTTGKEPIITNNQYNFSKMFEEIKAQPDKWGRVVESAIGAHLINYSENGKFKIYYWKDRNDEVDFVLQKGGQLIGIEVKSGGAKPTAGMKAFNEKFKPYKILLVGESGLHWKEFLKMNPEDLF